MSTDERAQFEAARRLIKARRYSEARAILYSLSHPAAQDWIAKLDRIDPPDGAGASGAASSGVGRHAAVPTLEGGQLRCELCGELELDGMRRCQRADCGYALRRTRGGHPLLGLLVVVVSVIMAGLLLGFGGTIVGDLPTDAETGAIVFDALFFGFMLLFSVIWLGGALSALITGLFMLLGEWVILFNPSNGALARRGYLFGFPLRRRIVVPVERLSVPAGPLAERKYPLSVALRSQGGGLFSTQQNQQVARMLVATVIDLAGREYVDVWRAQATDGLWGRRRDEYLILPGPRLGLAAAPEGTLEQTLLHTVAHWGKILTRSETHMARHVGPNLFTLVYQQFPRTVDSPAKDLLKPVERDAVRYEGDPDGDYATQHRAEAEGWYDALKQAEPDLLKALETQVTRALLDRTDTD